MISGKGSDYLDGGKGNDILTGGLGIDKVYGGKGNDIFKMTVGSGYDKVKDFKDGQDKIDISALGDTFSLVASGDDVKLFHGEDLIAKIYDTDKTDLTQSGDYLI